MTSQDDATRDDGPVPTAPAVAGEPVAAAASTEPAATYAFEPEEIHAYQPLLDQLRDESALRRETACWLLGMLRYKIANRPMSKLLTQDPDPFVRLGACSALAKIGDGWSVQAIIRGLRDEDALVREACVHALAKLGDKQAVYPLEQVVKNEKDKHLRILAETALLQLSGKAFKASSPWERKVFKYLRQIELEPENGNAHYNLAVSYFHSKRYEDARKYCNRARDLGANVDWLESKLAEVEAPQPEERDEGDAEPAGAPAPEVVVVAEAETDEDVLEESDEVSDEGDSDAGGSALDGA